MCDVAVAVAVAVSICFETEESPNCAVRKDRWATVLDNLKAAQADGKCNRKIPLTPMELAPWVSKGEMVR